MIGVECALAFAVLLLLFASLHVVAAKFGLVASHKLCDDGPGGIAFAPSVAAAMIAVFMLRCERVKGLEAFPSMVREPNFLVSIYG